MVVTDPDPDQAPQHKIDEVTVTDAASFIRYLDKHGNGEHTELRVHKDTVTARIDAGAQGTPGWDAHRLTLAPVLDDEWKAWRAIDGELLTQEKFAEFLEDHAGAVISPDAATMIEIATSMQINRTVAFEQAQRLQDGNIRFGYREDTTTAAGTSGQLEIPATITLALSPFRGGTTFKVTARLRWRLRGQQLHIGVKLERPTEVRDAAFKQSVDTVLDWNQAEDGTEKHLLVFCA